MYKLIVKSEQIRVIELAETIHNKIMNGEFAEVVKQFQQIPYRGFKDTCIKRPASALQHAVMLANETTEIYNKFKKTDINFDNILFKDNCFYFDEKSGRYLIKILDTISRLNIGQFWIISEIITTNQFEINHELKHQFDKIGSIMTNVPINGSWGIFHPEIHDDGRIAYDLLCVIRHKLAWDRKPNGDITVDFDRPWKTSTLDLATITKVD